MSRGWGADKPMTSHEKEKVMDMYYMLRGFRRWLVSEENRVTSKGDAYYCIQNKVAKGLEELMLLCGYTLCEEPRADEEEED